MRIKKPASHRPVRGRHIFYGPRQPTQPLQERQQVLPAQLERPRQEVQKGTREHLYWFLSAQDAEEPHCLPASGKE